MKSSPSSKVKFPFKSSSLVFISSKDIEAEYSLSSNMHFVFPLRHHHLRHALHHHALLLRHHLRHGISLMHVIFSLRLPSSTNFKMKLYSKKNAKKIAYLGTNSFRSHYLYGSRYVRSSFFSVLTCNKSSYKLKE